MGTTSSSKAVIFRLVAPSGSRAFSAAALGPGDHLAAVARSESDLVARIMKVAGCLKPQK
jgi:hypothetical protein